MLAGVKVFHNKLDNSCRKSVSLICCYLSVLMFEVLWLLKIYNSILILLHISFTVEFSPFFLVGDPDAFLEGARLGVTQISHKKIPEIVK